MAWNENDANTILKAREEKLRESQLSQDVYETGKVPASGMQGSIGQAMQFSPENWARDLFVYHSPTIDKVAKMDAVRDAAANLALVMIRNAPSYTDEFRSAISALEMAVMLTNKAITKY